MISGKYVRYRNIVHCILSDFFDSVREALGRKKKVPVAKDGVGYGRWVNLEEGGGVDMGIPMNDTSRKPHKKEEKKQ